MKKLLTLAIVLSVLLSTLTLAGGFISVHHSYADASGNTTQARHPSLQAFPTDNCIWINDFTPNAWVTLEIYDSEGGNLIFGPASLSTDDSGYVWWDGSEYDVDLLAGNYIVATDDVTGTARTLVPIQHTFDLLDFDADLARGKAPPFAPVVVHLGGSEPSFSLGVTTDANGDWIADFGAAGFDILPFMRGVANVSDEDGDETLDHPPYISAWMHWHYEVTPCDFTPNASVTIEVYDAPGGSLLFGPETHPTDTDGYVRPPLDLWAQSVRPVPGNCLVITDNVSNYSKTLIYPDDTVNPVDYMNDLVTGTALPFAPVGVHVDTQSGHYDLSVFADENGNWTADFGAMGVDLDWESSAAPWVHDQDGDQTLIPRLSWIMASLTEDWIFYLDFTPSATVTFEIYDSMGGNLVYGPKTHSTDSEWIFFPDVNLVPGNYIVATDDVTGRVKDLVLVGASVTLFDRELDLIEGTAPSFSTVEVDVTDLFWMVFERLRVVADGDGFWSADFGASGFDITEDMFVQAKVLDEDYDWSVAQPVPFVSVTIDIKPGSDPNCFNLDSNGVIPVAILGSATFDAADVDPSTVTLEGAAVRLKGKSGNYGSLEDVNHDGYPDLVVHIMDFSVSSGATTATLKGELFDGTPIEGSDSICIVP